MMGGCFLAGRDDSPMLFPIGSFATTSFENDEMSFSIDEKSWFSWSFPIFFDEDWFDSEASQPFAWMRTDWDGGQRFNYKLGQFYDTLQSHLD